MEIWTVCAGDAPPGEPSPKALGLHQQWGFGSAEEAVAARGIENQEAAWLVGADTVNFGIPDCIYRRSPAGDLLYPEDVFDSVHLLEKTLAADIASALASELRSGDVIVSPLAIGGHLDHVISRSAAELIDCALWYYADMPYLINAPESFEKATEGMQAVPHPVSANGLQAWQSGIAAYKSQISTLLENEGKIQDAIQHYWEPSQGIQLWKSV